MENSQACPSCPKRQKFVVNEENNLSEDEIEVLFNSASEDDSSESDYYSTSSLGEQESDDENPEPGTSASTSASDIPCEERQIPQQRALTWQENPVGMQSFVFSKTNEVLVPLPQSQRPLDYFFMFVTDEFWNTFMIETNKYAEKYFCSKNASWKSKIPHWEALTVPELLTFIGLLFHMGTMKSENLQDYWKDDGILYIKCFGTNMACDRFLLIMRCLHFSMNPEYKKEAPEDRLHKIRPLVEYFNNQMSKIYYPGKELCLGESLILYRGRLVFREYAKSKYHKYGTKIYMLTEPNGTVLKINVSDTPLSNCIVRRHATKITLELVDEFLDNGHAIYLDDFYNSFGLSEILLKRKTHCTGLLHRGRRGTAKEVLSAKLKKGETKSQYCEGIMNGKWKDREVLLYSSTEFSNEMVEHEDRKGRKIVKPRPIWEYIKHMNLATTTTMEDRLMACYPCYIISLQRYKKLTVHILNQMLLNSYFLYKKFSGRKISFYKFRLEVIHGLLKIGAGETETTTTKS